VDGGAVGICRQGEEVAISTEEGQGQTHTRREAQDQQGQECIQETVEQTTDPSCTQSGQDTKGHVEEVIVNSSLEVPSSLS